MLIRYFAAAKAATGVEQETLEFSDGAVLTEVVRHLIKLHPGTEVGHAPTLAKILARSSFLRNEVALRDFDEPLGHADVIDILPPFAGG
ncbi:MoaD/ThiS family protein [Arthrobacter sp. NPDC080031]|uniref:MoaD/ThiS family protein n=1 Tax=Arthrobacter sp. NPDC080031 TaxID=3155918 RepID=UPI00344C8701